MVAREAKLPEMLASLLRDRGYDRNRQPVLDAIGVSAASLSQYVRGQTTPSVAKLLALAEFFEVTLDYLVYGTPSLTLTTPRPDVVHHVRDALDDVRTLTTAHSALVGRVGRVLADRIDDVTRAALEGAGTSGVVEGLVKDDELVRLEARAVRADIVTIDLDADVIRMANGEREQGKFLDVVADAVRRGCSYRFVISSRPRTSDESVTAFRHLLTERVGPDLVRRRHAIRRATVPTVVGMGLYVLDVAALRADDPALLGQFASDISDDGAFGYLIRPQPSTDRDSIMDERRRSTARAWFENLWSGGEPV